jgi:L-2-hydroxyglutarate oxidase LhgO
MKVDVDCAVVGAGVIGLAIARRVAMSGRSVVIIEREKSIGSGISSRNSEVIHAGIYYDTGSLKAELCLKGREDLYAYCAARDIEHRRCGKLIVATDSDQRPKLEAIAKKAAANGVEDLRLIDAAEAKQREPYLHCHAALHSPSTGIIDSHMYMLSLLADAEEHGATIAYGSKITSLRAHADGIEISVGTDVDPVVKAGVVVNAAGLHAHELAGGIADFPLAHVPNVRFAKGTYFVLGGRAPFTQLIYPLPEPGGLGVHLTLDLAGAARFGPDVEWIGELNYDVRPERAEGFYASIRRFWPQLAEGQLHPGYSGIRPKLSKPGEPAADFLISGPSQHGVPGIINLFGIESPGLTASLALADRVEEMI